MEKDKQLDEYLQHVRLIHLSLLVVSATIAYLVISTWSSANELVIDLNEFTQMMEKASQSDKDPQKLAEILPDWKKIGVQPVEKSIETQLGKNFFFNGPDDPLRILTVEPSPLPREFKSLEDSRIELERRKWTIEVPDRIQSDLSDVRRWVHAVSNDKTPAIKMNIKSWPSNTQPGYADLEATITFTVTEYERDINGNTRPKQSVQVFTHKFENKEWTSPLVIGPVAAIALPLWRLLGVHWFVSAMLGLLAGLVGFRCAWISSKLAFKVMRI